MVKGKLGAIDPVIELPLVVGVPSRPATASPESPALRARAESLEPMVSLPPLAVTTNFAMGTELLCVDGSNVAVLDVSTGVMVCPAPPVEVKSIGVEAVGTVKLPVPAEVRLMAAPLFASF